MDVRAATDAAWRARLRANLSAAEAEAFARFALERVSRTFALNIRVLPAPLRGEVLHAYLYCRMADTLEDDARLPAPEKSALLHAFAALFDPELDAHVREVMAIAFTALLPAGWKAGDAPWEHVLLARAPLVLGAFSRMPAPARESVGACVREMCAGMAAFALRQHAVATRGGALIATVDELDRYCWYVAGTVGVFLADRFIAEGRVAGDRAARMRAHCVSFGNGLQLVNILKDLADDARRGVSWLPEDLLAREGLDAATFGAPEHREAARRAHAALFRKALGHLEEALDYTLAIPRARRRLRLFCLWPLQMAVETLALLAENAGALAGGARIKLTRARVLAIVRRTGVLWWSDRALRAGFAGPAARVRRALHDAGPGHTFHLP